MDLCLSGSDTFPVFIYFHGGGLTRKSPISGPSTPEKLPPFATHLLKNGVAVIRAEYRCYPMVTAS